MDQLDIQWGPQVRARIARGPRATEQALLRDIDRLLGDLGEEILGSPIVLVVPSRGLRQHLLSRLIGERGRGVAGLECVTHHRLAARLVEQSGLSPSDGPDLFPLIARRLADTEPALARSLSHLQDGYRSILPAVADLLDAGLDPAHHEALEELLEQEGGAVARTNELARAHAVVRVAVGTAATMRELGLERSSTLLRQAAEIVKTRARPYSTILVYGYSDATGVTTDFLQSLLQTYGGIVYLDQPPDPARPPYVDAGIAFTRRFTERLLAVATAQEDAVEIQSPAIDMFRAFGSDAEVREVGRRIRMLLDHGQRPEGIAVVARSIEQYREPVRIHFARLGIPYSGVGARAPNEPSSYRAAAILDLLRLRDRAPVERWLEARAASSFAAADFDLRLAYHSLGAGRLQDAAAIDIREATYHDTLSLPARTRLEVLTGAEEAGLDDNGHADSRSVVRRRKLPASVLQDDIERCRSLLGLLQQDSTRTVRAHWSALEKLVAEELEHDPDEGLGAELLSRARRVLDLLPADFGLDRDELHELLRQAWGEIGVSPLGGAGGGVQVLDVIEARASTCEHLFLLGLNRGGFPRSVHEDPVLSDAVRKVIGRSGFGLLPDLALKRDGLAEERFLFAQLLAASPSVTLSWQEVDDEHNFKTPSPLVERLRWSTVDPPETWLEPPKVDGVVARRPTKADDQPRTSHEAAIVAGLFGDRGRRRFREALAVALEDSLSWSGGDAKCAELAHIRTAILDEVDPSRWTSAGRKTFRRLGPYLGLVGPPHNREDPRAASDVSITSLERIATCPWRTFLERILRIEPAPDPLELLPTLDARLVGSVVHAVLEVIVSAEIGEPPEDLADAATRPGTRVPWPSEARLLQLVRRAAATMARRQGIALPGFDRVLAQFAYAYLRSAREIDWPDKVSRYPVVAVEFSTSLALDEVAPAIAFRADRLDRTDEGLLLTDYKTGKRLLGKSYSSLSAGTLRHSVATGEALQAAAYAIAAGETPARGRYLYLHPEIVESKMPEVEVVATDRKTVAAFRHAAGAALEIWRHGAFFPRLTRPRENREPEACERCEVAEACLRGDSGARSRLRLWNQALADSGSLPSSDAERAIAALWILPLGTGAAP